MDCLTARAIISEAVDREPVDPSVLDAAKAHCRRCAECASFATTVLALATTSPPEPTPELAGRIIEAVRAEAVADAERARAAAEATAPLRVAPEFEPSAATAPTPAPVPLETDTARSRRYRGRRLRSVLVGASVAAALLVGAVLLAVAGTRQLTNNSVTAGARFTMAPTSQSAPAPQTESLSSGAAKDSAGGTVATVPTSPSAIRATPPNAIVVGSVAYVSAGPAQVSPASLHVIGTTTSALGGSETRVRDVLAGQTETPIYVSDDTGTLIVFDRVTRSFNGTTYALESGDLTRFGEWPDLPARIPQPASADGAPTFVRVGTDETGVGVYRLVNDSADAGIAVAPGTQQGDAAQGNPNWTWWTVLR